jgi:hypothetical protein
MNADRAVIWTSVVTAIALASSCPAVAANGPRAETIVMIRHGEKPEADLGQLNCAGLNRALALPAVIEKQFGRPDAIFAPDPSEQVTEGEKKYDYVRPLATIEPTAIAFGLPVHASIGYSHIDALRQELESAAYANSLVIVAWEHKQIPLLAEGLMADFGSRVDIPKWGKDDFDSIYIVRIIRSDGNPKVVFDHRHEGLDRQSDTCPRQSAP